MTDLRTIIEAMPPEQKQGAIATLDAMTRPMTTREIEGALRLGGVSRARSIKLASALKHFHIVALMGPEERNHG